MNVSEGIERPPVEPRHRTAVDTVDLALAVARCHPAVFEELSPAEARARARELDQERRAGDALGHLAGQLVSVKANVDVRGLVTTAGSAALAHRAPAPSDAAIVRRLRTADALILGHTAMAELAESAVGRRPAIPNPLDPHAVSGGSSTGDAVAVARGIVSVAVATDEGGSARIPAAFCGIVGFRPSSRALPRRGILPLSPTLDGPGLLTTDTRDLIRTFTVLAGHPTPPRAAPAAPRLAVPREHVWDECEPLVRDAVRSAIDRLADHLPVDEIALPELTDLAELRQKGDFAAAETAAWIRSNGIDRSRLGPLALARVERGDRLSTSDYQRALTARRDLTTRIDATTRDWTALLMPTTPRLPPHFDGLTVEREARLNPLLLRNTRLANLLDRPAISLPTRAHPSTGLMLLGAAGSDTALLHLAAQAERLLGHHTNAAG